MDLLVLGLLSLVLSAQSLVSVCGVDDVSHLKNSGGHYLPISQKRNSACLLHSANVSYIYCQKENCKVSSEPEDLPLAIQGIVLLCGGLLCPCLRPKIKKEFEDDFLATKINPLDTDSSIETSEKITTTPSRVPPSPSRFVMSPPFRRIGSLHLSFHQISEATQRFSPLCKLGDGVVGTVYKAVLPDDQVVAIKIARKDQIPDLREEFSNEVEILAKIEHQNLVRLLGYTENEYEHIIITEYVPNGTLREHLDGLHGKILDFSQRLEIAIDVAHALTYLHVYAEKMIIHRDVRSSNILLTESYRAKVSDFGFASDSTDRKKSHAYTRVKGTAGYLDPEYLRTYQLTPKSDVFSFGILLVEILSSRRPIEMKRSPEEKITVTWAFKKFEEGNMYDILDPLLEEVVDHKVVRKMFNLAFDCSAPTCEDRPDMRAVGQQLWEIRKEYVKSHKRG